MDLYLKNLNQFYGTNKYHKIILFPQYNLTDGVKYIMENGYSWLVTDFLSLLKFSKKLLKEEFLSLKLKIIEEDHAIIRIGDGNKTFKKIQIPYTDAKTEISLFFCDNVLMLSGEY